MDCDSFCVVFYAGYVGVFNLVYSCVCCGGLYAYLVCVPVDLGFVNLLVAMNWVCRLFRCTLFVCCN